MLGGKDLHPGPARVCLCYSASKKQRTLLDAPLCSVMHASAALSCVLAPVDATSVQLPRVLLVAGPYLTPPLWFL